MEFCVVFAFTLWPFVYGSVGALLTTLPEAPISQGHLSSLLVSELVVLAMILPFLHARGWKASELGLNFTWRDVPQAALLLGLAYLGYMVLWLCVSLAFPEAASAAASRNLVGANLGLGTVIATSLVNGVFEELFVVGYLIQGLRSRVSVVAAINISVFIRLTYHLYQGSIGVIGIVPFGLVFAWWYVRSGRLWPLMIAHAAQDLIALAQNLE